MALVERILTEFMSLLLRLQVDIWTDLVELLPTDDIQYYC